MWPLRKLSFLIPTRCPACKNLITGTDAVCQGCLEEIKKGPRSRRCKHCGRKLISGTSNRCLSCIKNPPYIDEIVVYTDFSGASRELVHKMKFGPSKGLARFVGRLLAEIALPQTDALVPVPLSKGRLLKRGFNQSHIIADTLSNLKGIPLLPVVLKTKDIPPQSGLSRKERLRNIKGAFSVLKGVSLPQSLGLVDDVTTTGATLNEIARLLKQKGVSTVKAVVFARTPEE